MLTIFDSPPANQIKIVSELFYSYWYSLQMKHESVPKISALKISHEFPFKILKMNHFNFTK